MSINNNCSMDLSKVLPDEIWYRIFLEVGPSSALYSTCKRFRDLSKDEQLCKKFCEAIPDFNLPHSVSCSYAELYAYRRHCVKNIEGDRFGLEIDLRLKDRAINNHSFSHDVLCLQKEKRACEIYNLFDRTLKYTFDSFNEANIGLAIDAINLFMRTLLRAKEGEEMDSLVNLFDQFNVSLPEKNVETYLFYNIFKQIFYADQPDLSLTQSYKEDPEIFKQKIQQLQLYQDYYAIDYEDCTELSKFAASENYFAFHYYNNLIDIRNRSDGRRIVYLVDAVRSMAWVGDTLCYINDKSRCAINPPNKKFEAKELTYLPPLTNFSSGRFFIKQLDSRLAFVNEHSGQFIWNIEQNEYIKISPHQNVYDVSFDPDKKKLFILSNHFRPKKESSLAIYDLQTWSEITCLKFDEWHDYCYYKHNFIWLRSAQGTIVKIPGAQAICNDLNNCVCFDINSNFSGKDIYPLAGIWANEKFIFSMTDVNIYIFDFGVTYNDFFSDIPAIDLNKRSKKKQRTK